jgi:hypothetical protein
LGHVDLVTIFDCATEAELQGNGFANVELSLITRNLDLEQNPGIDGSGLRAGTHAGNHNEQKERNKTHILPTQTIKHQKLVAKLERRAKPAIAGRQFQPFIAGSNRPIRTSKLLSLQDLKGRAVEF